MGNFRKLVLVSQLSNSRIVAVIQMGSALREVAPYVWVISAFSCPPPLHSVVVYTVVAYLFLVPLPLCFVACLWLPMSKDEHFTQYSAITCGLDF